MTATDDTTGGAGGLTDDGAGVALGPRAVRLAALLETVAGRTIALPELWALWAAADPVSTGRPERRGDLAQVLQQLAAAGLVTPSK
jgi:hypothetical protein